MSNRSINRLTFELDDCYFIKFSMKKTGNYGIIMSKA